MDRTIVKALLVIFMVALVTLGGARVISAGWSPMECPVAEHLIDVWGTSGTNIFAVGHRGGIIHYDGDGNNDGIPDEVWEVMVPTGGMDNDLRGIWGASGNNIFAVGRGYVLNYNGSSWNDITSLVGIPFGTDFYNVWGSSYADVFIVGQSGTIFHYNGSTWSDRSIAALSASDIFGIWGSSATDVFASNDTGDILYYNGTIWSIVHEGSVPLYGIWGTSGSNVYVVGEGGAILHYDGSDWSAMVSGVSENLIRIWGSSADDIFVVGASGTILHYDGSWSAMESGTSNLLYGVWGSSSSNVFAVGESATILHYVPDVTTTTTIAVSTTTTTSTPPTTTTISTTTSVPDLCIVEEIYGNDAREAELLRYFRDGILSRTPAGRELIKLYYEWSPVVVCTAREDERFKEEIEEILDIFVSLLKEALE